MSGKIRDDKRSGRVCKRACMIFVVAYERHGIAWHSGMLDDIEGLHRGHRHHGP